MATGLCRDRELSILSHCPSCDRARQPRLQFLLDGAKASVFTGPVPGMPFPWLLHRSSPEALGLKVHSGVHCLCQLYLHKWISASKRMYEHLLFSEKLPNFPPKWWCPVILQPKGRVLNVFLPPCQHLPCSNFLFN